MPWLTQMARAARGPLGSDGKVIDLMWIWISGLVATSGPWRFILTQNLNLWSVMWLDLGGQTHFRWMRWAVRRSVAGLWIGFTGRRGRRGRRIERVRNPWVLAAVIQFREMSFQGDSVHGVSPVLVTGRDMGGPLRGCVAWCPLIWVLGNQRGGTRGM